MQMEHVQAALLSQVDALVRLGLAEDSARLEGQKACFPAMRVLFQSVLAVDGQGVGRIGIVQFGKTHFFFVAADLALDAVSFEAETGSADRFRVAQEIVKDPFLVEGWDTLHQIKKIPGDSVGRLQKLGGQSLRHFLRPTLIGRENPFLRIQMLGRHGDKMMFSKPVRTEKPIQERWSTCDGKTLTKKAYKNG